MSKKSVASPARKPAARIPARGRKALTLADITIQWQDGPDRTRTITGRQLAYLVTAAAEQCPSDEAIGDRMFAGEWIYKLRGLSALVFPDAGTSIHEDDARALVSDLIQTAAADLATAQLDSDKWAQRFRIVA